jgi:hypothetical protein
VTTGSEIAPVGEATAIASTASASVAVHLEHPNADEHHRQRDRQ